MKRGKVTGLPTMLTERLAARMGVRGSRLARRRPRWDAADVETRCSPLPPSGGGSWREWVRTVGGTLPSVAVTGLHGTEALVEGDAQEEKSLTTRRFHALSYRRLLLRIKGRGSAAFQ